MEDKITLVKHQENEMTSKIKLVIFTEIINLPESDNN